MKQDLMVTNRITDKTYMIMLKGKLVGILSAYEEIDTEFLKGLRASLAEDITCRERREQDEKDLKAGKYDKRIEVWERKHSEPARDVENVVNELKKNMGVVRGCSI